MSREKFKPFGLSASYSAPSFANKELPSSNKYFVAKYCVLSAQLTQNAQLFIL